MKLSGTRYVLLQDRRDGKTGGLFFGRGIPENFRSGVFVRRMDN